MADALEVRAFTTEAEYAGMVDYFLGTGDEFLTGMGVDVAKLPTRQEWLESALADHDRPDTEKQRFYVGWRLDGELVGHSSISNLEHGRSAHCHQHLWRSEARYGGRGARFLAKSIDIYFERFRLESMACEPFAENEAPRRVLQKLGFELARTYLTFPTKISLEQLVSRYEVGRERWAERREAGHFD